MDYQLSRYTNASSTCTYTMKSTAIAFITTPSPPPEEDYFCRSMTSSPYRYPAVATMARHHQASDKLSVLSIHNLLSPDPEPSYPRGGNNHGDNHNKKTKRKRASPSQLLVLNRVFNQTSFPSTELRNHLGKQLNMSPRTVQIWFQNRRQALRTQSRSTMSKQKHIPASPPLSPLPHQPRTPVALPMTKTTSTSTEPTMNHATPVKICLPPLLFPDTNNNVTVTTFPRHYHQPPTITPMCLPSPTSTDCSIYRG